jgi:hypothetical protein
MRLNDTNQLIKDSFQDIIGGKFNNKFSTEQLKIMLELSFLYNHITFESDAILFEYSGQKLRLKGINDLIHSSHKFGEDEILNMIKSEEIFKSSYASFLRDLKIDEILK